VEYSIGKGRLELQGEVELETASVPAPGNNKLMDTSGWESAILYLDFSAIRSSLSR
jgi:hypothetical protein